MFDPQEYSTFLNRSTSPVVDGFLDGRSVFDVCRVIYNSEMTTGFFASLSCAALVRRCTKLADELASGRAQHVALVLALFLQQLYLVKLRHKVSTPIAEEMLAQASRFVDGAAIMATARQVRAERTKK
jgi:hypothetical protein